MRLKEFKYRLNELGYQMQYLGDLMQSAEIYSVKIKEDVNKEIDVIKMKEHFNKILEEVNCDFLYFLREKVISNPNIVSDQVYGEKNERN